MGRQKYHYKIKQHSAFAGNLKKLSLHSLATIAVLAGTIIPATAVYAKGGVGGGGGGGGGGSTSAGGGSSTGGGSSSTSTTPKNAGCDPIGILEASSDTNGISVNQALSACVSGKSRTTIRLRNAAGTVVASVVDPQINVVNFASVQFATTYTVEMEVYSLRDLMVLGTKSIPVTTITLPQNCAQITANDGHGGYWGTYAAVWINYAVFDCGYGRETVEVILTNRSTGQEAAHYNGYPMSALIDYEGPQVQFNTTYDIHVIVHGAMGEVLDESYSSVDTPIL